MLQFAQGPTLLSLGVESQAPVQPSMRVTQETLREFGGRGRDVRVCSERVA